MGMGWFGVRLVVEYRCGFGYADGGGVCMMDIDLGSGLGCGEGFWDGFGRVEVGWRWKWCIYRYLDEERVDVG